MDDSSKKKTDKDMEFIFADEQEDTVEDKIVQSSLPPWKVMIADDESEVHSITKMVLSEYTYEERPLQFISAHSGKEAKGILENEKDIAVLLLDVVMETDDAGLTVAEYIRKELKNDFIRIIMRTGQPGKAPEKEIIMGYDINDYKSKTELTSQKLFTTITSSLRSYNSLKTIEKNRKGLEQIINSSSSLFEYQSLSNFASGVLTQLLSILKLDENSMYLQMSAFAASKEKEEIKILAATGEYEKYINLDVTDSLPEEVLDRIDEVMIKKSDLFMDNIYIGYYGTETGGANLLFLSGCRNLTELDRNLIRIFSSNVAIAFDNIYLSKDIIDTQKEVIFTLGEVVETRSKETANHVERVAQFSYLLAIKAGMDQKSAERLKMASPMHDIGKIGIPDSILNKPGKLTPEEFDTMKSHTSIGYDILKNSKREIMKTASIVALQHHERWDGQGYPNGLKGEDIHIYGRIMALADVFDALSHERVYKKAWEMERIIELFEVTAGRHFDPKLTRIFLDSIDEFIAINQKYPDAGL